MPTRSQPGHKSLKRGHKIRLPLPPWRRHCIVGARYIQGHDLCMLAVISAPTDVRVRRVSMTAVEVGWNPPAFHGVAGFRVQYSAVTDDDERRRPRFLDVGPYTIAQVNIISATVITIITSTCSSIRSHGTERERLLIFDLNCQIRRIYQIHQCLHSVPTTSMARFLGRAVYSIAYYLNYITIITSQFPVPV